MIHWDRVNELRAEVGDEDFEKVVEIFLEEVEEVVDRFRKQDQSGLAADLHFLRGCAINIGFDQFSRTCEESERAAGAGPISETELRAIVDSYDRSRAEFMERLDFACA